MNFIRTDPNLIPFEALSFLKKAIDKNPLPDDQTIWEVLEDCRNGEGEIYACEKGAMYLEIYPQIINVALLGGDDIHEWKDYLVKFLRSIMKERGIKHLSVIGRHGWSKIFKELTPIGTFYFAE